MIGPGYLWFVQEPGWFLAVIGSGCTGESQETRRTLIQAVIYQDHVVAPSVDLVGDLTLQGLQPKQIQGANALVESPKRATHQRPRFACEDKVPVAIGTQVTKVVIGTRKRVDIDITAAGQSAGYLIESTLGTTRR